MAWILKVEGCADRRFTKRANLDRAVEYADLRGETYTIREVADRPSRRSMMDRVAEELGLVKVRGTVSGRTYYE